MAAYDANMAGMSSDDTESLEDAQQTSKYLLLSLQLTKQGLYMEPGTAADAALAAASSSTKEKGYFFSTKDKDLLQSA
jgi:hypothetical protein